MARHLYYEDLEVGAPIPTLIKHPTTRQLVMWAGASGDYYEIHYDNDFAISVGLPGVIVHGWLTTSFLGQMLTDWIGELSQLTKFSCSYRGMLFPGEPVICKGRVISKHVQDGQHFIGADIWAENSKGELVVPGNATIIVSSKRGLEKK